MTARNACIDAVLTKLECEMSEHCVQCQGLRAEVDRLKAKLAHLSDVFFHPFMDCNPPDGTCHECGQPFVDRVHLPGLEDE